jgi:hypothetical protein
MERNNPYKEEDPHKEPKNSTVDDWHGQVVDRDEQRADELLEASGGDAAAAERQFDREGRGPARHDPNAPARSGET